VSTVARLCGGFGLIDGVEVVGGELGRQEVSGEF
jgi:hypothetical protein